MTGTIIVQWADRIVTRYQIFEQINEWDKQGLELAFIAAMPKRLFREQEFLIGAKLKGKKNENL